MGESMFQTEVNSKGKMAPCKAKSKITLATNDILWTQGATTYNLIYV